MGRWTLGDVVMVGYGLLIPIGDERLPCKGDAFPGVPLLNSGSGL